MAAAITAMMLWGSDVAENLHVCYGDNDRVRFFFDLCFRNR